MDWRNKAIAAYERGDRTESARAFALALEEDPSSHVARDLAIVYCELGRFADAVQTLERYLQRYPDDVVAWCTISNALLEQNHSGHALQAARKAVSLAPSNWIALIALANALTDLGAFDEATEALAAAALAAPLRPEPLVNQSALFTRTRRPLDAIACAEHAIAIAPEDIAAHINLAIAHLLRGEYALGFAEYEWRLRDPARASLYNRGAIPRWDGSALPNGTLLVGIEQGLGDFICFSRLLVEARKRIGRIVCEVPETLLKLYRGFEGIDAVRSLSSPEERYDAFVPIASLPHVLEYSPDSHPTTPYLRTDPARVQGFTQRIAALGKRRSIGIVWSGNPAYRMDRHRSIDISAFAALAEFDDIAWISLQKGPVEELAGALPFTIHRFGQTLANFADTAAAIEALDLVITVDTAVAHLAGALGKPVWTMIGFAQHWLWQLDRSDSPWYPSMKLFRQHTPNHWGDVIAEIASQLHTYTR